MLSRRRFLQLVASSIVALAARPKEVFASTGNIDGEQIQFTSEIAQELADKYIKGLLGYSYTPSDPIPFVDVDGFPLGYIVPVVTSNRAAGYLVLDASDDEILTGYRFGDGLVSPMDRGGDLGVESYSFNNPVVMINPFEFGVQSLDGSITTNCGRTIPAVSIEGRPVVLSNKPSSWNDVVIYATQMQDYTVSGFRSISQFMSYDESEIKRLTAHYACMVTAFSNVAELYGIANLYSDPSQYMQIWSYTNTHALSDEEQTVPGVVLGGTPISTCATGFTNYCASRGSTLIARTVSSPAIASIQNEINSNRPNVLHASLYNGSAHSVTAEAYATLTGKKTGETRQMIGIADGWNSSLSFLKYDQSYYAWTYGTTFSK